MSVIPTAASTAQQPWGNQEDIEWARKHVETNIASGRIIHAVLRPSPEAIETVSTAQFKVLCFLPCFWPHLLIGSPCLICCCLNMRKSMEHMRYILTNKEVLRVVLDHTPACACGCGGTSGRDSATLPYGSVISCDVNHAGRPCCGCIQNSTDAVSVNEAGVVYGGKHGRARNLFYVPQPEHFQRLLNELRELDRPNQTIIIQQTHNNNTSYAQPSAPPAYGAPSYGTTATPSPGIRLFVALASAPSQFEIISNFEPSQGLDGLSKLVADQFSQSGTRYVFTMAEIGATIKDTQAIQANDKLIANKTI